MFYELLASSVLNVFKAFASLCTCLEKRNKSYDVLCSDNNFLHCSGNLDYPIRLTLKKAVVFHEMPCLRFAGYDTLIPGENIILKNSGTSSK